MEYITLGRTNIKVSRISLGTWSYGGGQHSGRKPTRGMGGQDDDDSRAALIKAFEKVSTTLGYSRCLWRWTIRKIDWFHME
ncbi:MAG: hypothetical protein Ct9H300mP29_1560 [Candidatus Neomarinimicrobiota bacterium]|nr:MAG: hypothetical protein Ct9H300mP29_1560 [Candidatus Neomarinimicrobiota bacterium]